MQFRVGKIIDENEAWCIVVIIRIIKNTTISMSPYWNQLLV